MKQDNSVKQQYADQATKGGFLGLATYLLIQWNVDPAIIALALPALSAGLSWASTQIGDENIASFFGINDKSAPVAKKSPAKKSPAKKKQ